ncbi:hypothetical protein K2D_04140 [Planctomycetes bacterium K2D]|uniref:Uncharacterized protein n=2 Tax=Botrimarina mediterranea TaxID=2528022 RepID=A0A518K3C7_9BACT|nr:hypothetical protein Spa11_04610 [Botrimarina mediterranea]QDV76831.1 hypothetical protein K2D_04140 [Planctomycetes bacterium K2D]
MAAPGKELVYRYTLVTNGPVEGVFPDKGRFVEMVKERSQNNYRNSSDMECYRQSGVTLVYVYFDEEGNEYAKFKIRPE